MSPKGGAPAGFPGPTVLRRILAARLRELRQEAGLTLDQVAGKLMVSAGKISRLETDERPPQPRDVRDLAVLYGLAEAEMAELMELVQGARERAWWQAFDSLSAPEKMYIGLEAAAGSVHAVDLLVIHGLAQTPAYTSALLMQVCPQVMERHPERLAQIGKSRAIRQGRLSEPAPLALKLVIGAAALLTEVGSAQVMYDQVTRLLELGRLANVSLQVLPFSAGATAAHGGSFGILGFQLPYLSEAVYLEGLAGQLILDRPQDVDQYRESFTATSERALSLESSREYLEGLQLEWQGHLTAASGGIGF